MFNWGGGGGGKPGLRSGGSLVNMLQIGSNLNYRQPGEGRSSFLQGKKLLHVG